MSNITDIEQGRRLSIGQLLLTHTLQNRQFEIAVALQPFLFQPSSAMYLIGRDPLAKG